MTKYLQSYDRNRKRIGILSDAYDIQRRRRINSDYTLSFFVPMSGASYRDKLPLKGHVMDERGQYYVINSKQRVRDGRKLTAAVECSHVMFKLADYKVPYASYIKESYGAHIKTLTDVISAATGGRFTFSIDDTFPLYDVKDWGRTNCLAALNDVLKMYGAEVEPDNFVIHLRKKIGADNGLQYRIRKNVVSSTFKDDSGSLCTRLYAQMKDGRTWIGQPASILTAEERALLSAMPGAIVNGNLAVNYLISPRAGEWASDSVPFYDDEIIEQDVTDPLKLLEAARKALKEREVPLLEITVNAADVFKLDKTEPKPGLGDSVKCVDPEMEMTDIDARITELTEYPFAMDKHAQVTIANVMRRDYADIIANLEDSRRTIEQYFSGGQIRTDVFEAFAKQAVIDVNNSKTEVKYDIRGIVLENKTDWRNQVILTSDGIIFSSDGGASATTAVNHKGIAAPAIVGQLGNFVSLLIGSGNNVTQINTNGIAAGHATFSSAPFQVKMNGDVIARSIKLTGQIDNSSMYSSEITGGTITGALFRTSASGARVEIDYSGWRTYDSSGMKRISIESNNSYGMNAISFAKSNGSPSGTINGSSIGLTIESYGTLFLGALSGGTVQFQGNVDFSTANNIYGLTTASISGLSSALLTKATKGDPTTPVTGGAHNHGIPDGTQLMTADGKTVTYRAYAGDTHYHVI